mgnify:CR=1 FL=1
METKYKRKMQIFNIRKKGKLLLQKALKTIKYKNSSKLDLMEKSHIRNYMNKSWGRKTDKEIKSILLECIDEYKNNINMLNNYDKLEKEKYYKKKYKNKNTKRTKRIKRTKRKIPSSPLNIEQKIKKEKLITYAKL